ncbi:hypothetical protein DAPPUDRAFT_234786 [Daphnia pulex]|uniref:Uncharacterized protein n=1 Tax=Daphnia pulex TaxID=6669 RepID=E9FXF1_DAPPU|nr:hypothetical protein DAPPUDRAFT_234786 [Daphnia pulex]|eukprot:EFX88068.1 hypothetical protein DAPPUDRAFT_234786 [Daphnia pulex]
MIQKQKASHLIGKTTDANRVTDLSFSPFLEYAPARKSCQKVGLKDLIGGLLDY